MEPITVLEAGVELESLLSRLEKTITEMPDEDFGDITSQIEDAKKLAEALEEKGQELEESEGEDEDGEEGGDEGEESDGGDAEQY